MKSLSLISRKKRSYFSKPAKSYVWWSSAEVFQSPKIDRTAGASEKESLRGCGSSKSEKVSKKREPGGMVSGDKGKKREPGTPSIRIRLKGKSTKLVDQTGKIAGVPDFNDCSLPQTTDSAFELAKDCSRPSKGECNRKYNWRNRGIWPPQADYAFVNSKHSYTCPDTKSNCNHTSKKFDGIIHDMTRNDVKVPLATSLEESVNAMKEKADNSILNPETSPDSEVINPVPEVCLAERAEEVMHNNVSLTSPSNVGVQGGGTSINFTYSSRKKGKKKEIPVLGVDCNGTCQPMNSTCFVPDPNFEATTNAPIKIMSGVLDPGSEGINTLEHDSFQDFAS